MAQAAVTPDASHARRTAKRLLRQLDHAMFMTQEAEQDVNEYKARLLALAETAKTGDEEWESAKRIMAQRVKLVRQRLAKMMTLRSQAIDLGTLRLRDDTELYLQLCGANNRVLSYALQLERHGY